MDSERILFIVVGVVIVFGVGQLLVRSGRRFLAPAEKEAAGPAARLVAVLFHLLTLGIVVLLSVVSIGSTSELRFLYQLGILLIVLAAVYGIALMQMNRRRDEALVAEVEQAGLRRAVPADDDRRDVRMQPHDPAVDVRPVER